MSGNFDLKDYETVKSRKKRFYADHKDGRIVAEAVTITENQAVFKAVLYRNGEDQKNGLPWSTGHAQEFKGVGSFANKTSWCENCEESAIGRALDNAGYAGNDKCSREEMEKVQRSTESVKPKSDEDLIDKKIMFGGPSVKGKTWRQLANENPDRAASWFQSLIEAENKKEPHKFKETNLKTYGLALALAESKLGPIDMSDDFSV